MEATRTGIAWVAAALLALGGCAGTGTTRTGGGSASAKKAAPIQRVVGDPAPGSKFSKVEIGMPMKQVYDLIGEPTDTKAYVTGKAFIPFYFGNDASRFEALYKGWGRIVFTGANAFGGGSYKVYQVINDGHEDGYNN